MPRNNPHSDSGATSQRLKPRKGFWGAILLGFSVIVLTVGAIAFWGGTAPLSSAVIAQGAFVTTSKNKIIQHFEGGIVHEILVKEGDLVTPGQTMIRLDETAARSKLRRLELKKYSLLAQEARFVAERDSRALPRFPIVLASLTSDHDIVEILEGQRTEFLARKQENRKRIEVLKRREAAIYEEIAGLVAQKEAALAELALIDRELKGSEKLFKKGLTSISKVLALKRARAKLKGSAGATTAQIGRAKERIEEQRSEVHLIKAKCVEEAVRRHREVQAQLDDIGEQMKTTRNIVQRLEIRSPVKGIVVKLSQTTTGGVVSSGQEIIELLPLDDDLIIEAKVRPSDIDVVKVGQKSWIRLTALNQRITPVVQGYVAYVSADRLNQAENGMPFYVVRVELDKEEVANVKDFHALPGMPAEIYVNTGERTLIQYLFQPFLDSFSRSFRES
jgi:membrane fusion protein, type I secretion system